MALTEFKKNNKVRGEKTCCPDCGEEKTDGVCPNCGEEETEDFDLSGGRDSLKEDSE